MGVDTKILLTSAPDILSVLEFAALKYRDASLRPSGTGFYWLDLKDGDDIRMIAIFPPDMCVSDYKDIHPAPAVLMSLGCWGNSEVIARRFVAHFGGLFMVDDCVDDWQALPSHSMKGDGSWTRSQ